MTNKKEYDMIETKSNREQISAMHKNLYAAYAARAPKVCRSVAPHRKIVIPRKGEALTWESPARQYDEARTR